MRVDLPILVFAMECSKRLEKTYVELTLNEGA